MYCYTYRVGLNYNSCLYTITTIIYLSYVSEFVIVTFNCFVKLLASAYLSIEAIGLFAISMYYMIQITILIKIHCTDNHISG